MKAFLVLSTCCLLFTSCTDRSDSRTADHRNAAAVDRHAPVETSAEQKARLVTPADKNDRFITPSDQKVLKTPTDQSENEGDRRITQQARKAVVDRDDFSTNAKNIKIITIERVVQLRGGVDNDRERAAIVEIIRAVPGVQNVDDKLEVNKKEE